MGSFLLLPLISRAAKTPLRGQAKAKSKISAGQVFRETLKNGLRVIIVYDPLAPVVTSVVNYKVGSDEVPQGFPGMAHATEHMMFRGSPGISSDQLAEIGADVGGVLTLILSKI